MSHVTCHLTTTLCSFSYSESSSMFGDAAAGGLVIEKVFLFVFIYKWCDILRVTCQMSHVTFYMSHIICKVSKCHGHTDMCPLKILLNLRKNVRFVCTNWKFHAFDSIFWLFGICLPLWDACLIFSCAILFNLQFRPRNFFFRMSDHMAQFTYQTLNNTFPIYYDIFPNSHVKVLIKYFTYQILHGIFYM